MEPKKHEKPSTDYCNSLAAVGLDVELDLDLDSYSDSEDDSQKSWHKSPLHVRRIKRKDGRPVSAEVNYDKTSRKLLIYTLTDDCGLPVTGYGAEQSMEPLKYRKEQSAFGQLRSASVEDFFTTGPNNSHLLLATVDESPKGELYDSGHCRASSYGHIGHTLMSGMNSGSNSRQSSRVYLTEGKSNCDKRYSKAHMEKMHGTSSGDFDRTIAPNSRYYNSSESELGQGISWRLSDIIGPETGVCLDEHSAMYDLLDQSESKKNGKNQNLHKPPEFRYSFPNSLPATGDLFNCSENVRRVRTTEWSGSELNHSQDPQLHVLGKHLMMDGGGQNNAELFPWLPPQVNNQDLLEKRNTFFSSSNTSPNPSGNFGDWIPGRSTEEKSPEIKSNPFLAVKMGEPLTVEIPQYDHQEILWKRQNDDSFDDVQGKYVRGKFEKPEKLEEQVADIISRELGSHANGTCPRKEYEREKVNKYESSSKVPLINLASTCGQDRNFLPVVGDMRPKLQKLQCQTSEKKLQTDFHHEIDQFQRTLLKDIKENLQMTFTSSEPSVLTASCSSTFNAVSSMPELTVLGKYRSIHKGTRLNENYPFQGHVDTKVSSEILSLQDRSRSETSILDHPAGDYYSASRSRVYHPLQNRPKSDSNVDMLPTPDIWQNESYSYLPLVDLQSPVNIWNKFPGVSENCWKNESALSFDELQSGIDSKIELPFSTSSFNDKRLSMPVDLELQESNKRLSQRQQNVVISNYISSSSSVLERNVLKETSHEDCVHSLESVRLRGQDFDQEPDKAGQRGSLPLVFYNSKYKHCENDGKDSLAMLGEAKSEVTKKGIGKNDQRKQFFLEKLESTTPIRYSCDLSISDLGAVHNKPPKPKHEVAAVEPKDWHYSTIYQPSMLSPVDEESPMTKQNDTRMEQTLMNEEETVDNPALEPVPQSPQDIESKLIISCPMTIPIKNCRNTCEKQSAISLKMPPKESRTSNRSSLCIYLSGNASDRIDFYGNIGLYTRRIKQIPSTDGTEHQNTNLKQATRDTDEEKNRDAEVSGVKNDSKGSEKKVDISNAVAVNFIPSQDLIEREQLLSEARIDQLLVSSGKEQTLKVNCLLVDKAVQYEPDVCSSEDPRNSKPVAEEKSITDLSSQKLKEIAGNLTEDKSTEKTSVLSTMFTSKKELQTEQGLLHLNHRPQIDITTINARVFKTTQNKVMQKTPMKNLTKNLQETDANCNDTTLMIQQKPVYEQLPQNTIGEKDQLEEIAMVNSPTGCRIIKGKPQDTDSSAIAVAKKHQSLSLENVARPTTDKVSYLKRNSLGGNSANCIEQMKSTSVCISDRRMSTKAEHLQGTIAQLLAPTSQFLITKNEISDCPVKDNVAEKDSKTTNPEGTLSQVTGSNDVLREDVSDVTKTQDSCCSRGTGSPLPESLLPKQPASADTTESNLFHEMTLEWSPNKNGNRAKMVPDQCSICSREAQVPVNSSLRYYKMSHSCSRSTQQITDTKTLMHSLFLINSGRALSFQDLNSLFSSRNRFLLPPLHKSSISDTKQRPVSADFNQLLKNKTPNQSLPTVLQNSDSNLSANSSSVVSDVDCFHTSIQNNSASRLKERKLKRMAGTKNDVMVKLDVGQYGVKLNLETEPIKVSSTGNTENKVEQTNSQKRLAFCSPTKETHVEPVDPQILETFLEEKFPTSEGLHSKSPLPKSETKDSQSRTIGQPTLEEITEFLEQKQNSSFAEERKSGSTNMKLLTYRGPESSSEQTNASASSCSQRIKHRKISTQVSDLIANCTSSDINSYLLSTLDKSKKEQAK